MDFGRVSDLRAIDFSLPVDDPDNPALLGSLPRGGAPIIRVGTPRWADPGFVGALYPKGTRRADYLARYGEQFGTVELNSTYYGVQVDSIPKWREAVPEGFRFCPKIPQRISHDLQLVGAEQASEEFFAALAAFGERLGPAWLLLPETFGPERYGLLRAWLRRFGPRQHRGTAAGLGLEVRHPHWFSHPRARPGLFRLCEEHGVTLMMSDVAGRRDVLHQRLTSGRAMVRFVGNRHDRSDFVRLDAWVERLVAWCRLGLREVYFFLHQPEEELNVEIAEHFVPRLNRALHEAGLAVDVPEVRRPARQRSLFGD